MSSSAVMGVLSGAGVETRGSSEKPWVHYRTVIGINRGNSYQALTRAAGCVPQRVRAAPCQEMKVSAVYPMYFLRPCRVCTVRSGSPAGLSGQPLRAHRMLIYLTRHWSVGLWRMDSSRYGPAGRAGACPQALEFR